MVICGDFNCRVGLGHAYIVYDRNTANVDDTDYYIPDTPLSRVSEDRATNGQDKKLLDLCKATKLRIANGTQSRLSEDMDHLRTKVGGNFSVIDYLLLCECDFNIIKNFNIF